MPLPLTLAALLPSIGWMMLAAGFLTTGDVMFRTWQMAAWSAGFWLTLAVYATGIFFLMLSFFGEHIAIASVICIVFNSVAYLLIAHWLFGDSVTPWQLFGMGLGIAAIFAMHLGGK